MTDYKGYLHTEMDSLLIYKYTQNIKVGFRYFELSTPAT